VLLAPFFGLLLPLILHAMDGLDKAQTFSLGFRIRASKSNSGNQSAKSMECSDPRS
jgi:hypothetical protein